jgi:hypothetical protein
MTSGWTIILVDWNDDEQYRTTYYGEYARALEKGKQLLKEFKSTLGVVDFLLE